MGTRRLRQGDGGTRTGPVFYQGRQVFQLRLGGIPCRVYDVDDVVDNAFVHVQLGDAVPRFHDRLGRGDGIDGDGITTRHASHDLLFFIARGISYAQLEHEAVHLCLGKGIGPLLLDGILRGEHQKRLVESKGLAA